MKNDEKYFKIINPNEPYIVNVTNNLVYRRDPKEVRLPILQEKGVTICPLYIAIVNHEEAEVKKLMEYIDPSGMYLCNIHPSSNPDFNEGIKNWTYLSYAIFENYLPTIKILLEDIRVVRSIYKNNYHALKRCLENPFLGDALLIILNVIGQDANEPNNNNYDLHFIKNAFLAEVDRTVELFFTVGNLPQWLIDLVKDFMY